MKILVVCLFLSSCGSMHYITKGRKACDRRSKIINANKKLWMNMKLVERHIEECSYYYDVAH